MSDSLFRKFCTVFLTKIKYYFQQWNANILKRSENIL